MTPKYYTEKEGGVWKRWPDTIEFYEAYLGYRVPEQAEDTTIEIGTLHVHSLAFGSEDSDVMRRWDCVHGFTAKVYVEQSLIS